ncbi:MAG: thioesterase family protein [Methylobacteriaceae bacterium]|nr:thioesterase family protein [Methylobacteriaceae bacterium]
MNLWLRLICSSSPCPSGRNSRCRIASARAYRVLPSDLDINMHMTNSRYPASPTWRSSISSSARACCARRSRARLAADAAASKIRFRRELKAFRNFRVETRIRWWNETNGIFEHRFITRGRDGSDIVAAVMLAKGCFYAPKEKRFVAFAELLAALGLPAIDPPEPTSEIVAFMQAEEELRLAT